jgi:hypothetical protein
MKPFIESIQSVRRIPFILLFGAALFLIPSAGRSTWLPTLSPTWPISPSPQVTPGCTAACTMTVAATNTPTSTPTQTNTFTETPTATSTSKTPGICSKSPTLTPTETGTPTETLTVTPTGTPTSRRTPEGPIVFPNPWDGKGPVKVWLKSETVIRDVNLKVYTTAYRVIAEVNYPRLAPTDRVISWDGRDRKDRPLANGAYHLLLETASGSYRLKLVVLK